MRDDVDDELDAHLQMRVDELRARGIPPDAARRQAMQQLGDLETTRRYCQQQDKKKERLKMKELILQDLAQDIRI
ncbi:MAG: hypothetical protein H0U19_01850, partial [Acidobacteria bacterium]|nr:hypothetical protein [Acidobacteriota bacterium]